jgi:uncharacterized membrane protein YpjA
LFFVLSYLDVQAGLRLRDERRLMLVNKEPMGLSLFWSKAFLTQRWVLWSLFWANLLGTIYGYMWYGNQIVYTVTELKPWLVIFVPDSPTASLFFTIALGYLLADAYTTKKKQHSGLFLAVRGIIEALAVITLFKYGVWAVVMIFAAGLQGDVLSWKDWMLVVSHSAMAVEGLLFLRLFHIRLWHIAVVAAWTLTNDTMDYSLGIYPWLPRELLDDLTAVEWFSIALSWLSVAVTLVLFANHKKPQ